MVSPLKCLLASALVVSCVNAHGWLSKPAATFSNEAGDKSQFIATIEASSSGFKGTFNTAPADNVASFTKAFDASTYKSLKAFIDDKAKITVTGATLTCGNAEPDATAQPLPAKLEWYHSETEGFTASHEGPCEAWCDKERVFHDENCAAHFTTAPAEMPYEKTKCTGASTLTFYWMAMHGPTWQVYVNCAPLSGGSGSGATTQSSGSSATTTASSSGGSPAAQTPSSGGSPSTPTTGSSSADTPSVTPAPASGSSPSVTPAPASGGSPSTPSTNTSPSTSTTSAPSTSTTDESDCGSYDVAGSDEDCGSYDVAGGSADEGQDTTQTSTGGNTYQQSSTTTGGNTYQQGSTKSGGNTYQQGSTNTGKNTKKWSNTGGNNQWSNVGAGSQQNPYQGTGTGSQNSFDFNTFQGTTNAGTVAPQYM
ncbi:hypothetical protein JG687_00011821 [Phytophthora cactorum]|uniref:Uncharacterized protein n=1 Tax=Phytophthora cactorum TaxID=29920 RepID=A0A8T1U5X7_9STRA|nr:hypothetical protein PC120_g16304 [Phytophthora cactorum]KAG3058017.1 hypothetical protein PC121_g14574 [Phytophthora cactorum]KAG3175944.1 hypothetical protein PC128_g17483 [Phytophthora cactorum]KAG4051818.1 hypothetical protein PC123_g12984 [Phytophthora cactorum]KAG6954431.1 hypothetical protein JG687_00011821 [Phytophthora cactorum]